MLSEQAERETSAKAKASLVLIFVTIIGLVAIGNAHAISLGSADALFMRFLGLDSLVVAAILLGHFALRQVKKSQGRVKGKALAVVALILSYPILVVSGLITAFTVHDVGTFRIAQNEQATVMLMRNIIQAEEMATKTHPATEGRCNLNDLAKLDLFDNATARGESYGYSFKLTCANPSDVAAPPFQVVATPTKPGQTGKRVFCYSDGYGLVRYSPDVAVQCDANSQALN